MMSDQDDQPRPDNPPTLGDLLDSTNADSQPLTIVTAQSDDSEKAKRKPKFPLVPNAVNPRAYTVVIVLLIFIGLWSVLAVIGGAFLLSELHTQYAPVIVTATPFRPFPTVTPFATSSLTLPPSMPTALYHNLIGMGGYYLLTKAQIGDMPARTRVRISGAWLDGGAWMYQVVTEDERFIANVRDDELTLLGGIDPTSPTPTPAFGSLLGMEQYAVVTRTRLGTLAAGTRVRVGQATLSSDGWVYLVTPNGQDFVEAREEQLAPAPDVTLGAPTPTMLVSS
jgi:hypothetical protein